MGGGRGGGLEGKVFRSVHYGRVLRIHQLESAIKG